MRFLFVRHGQPEWFRDGAAVDDPVLTPLGWQQARHLGTRFAVEHVDRLLVSPLVRARQTAEPIAEALGLEPEVHDWLAEIASPPWFGAPIDHVQAVFDEHRDKPVDDHWEGLAGGESFRDFEQRVTSGLQGFLDDVAKPRLLERPALFAPVATDPADEPTVAVVAHGGTNGALLCYLLGFDAVPWEWERLVSFHASVSEVRPVDVSHRHAYSLFRFSDVAHLPPGLQTR